MRGCGWEAKNAKCRELKNPRCRNRDDLVVKGCSGVEYGWEGPRTQGFGAMTPQWPSNRVYLFPQSSETRPLFSELYLLCLPNWQWVVPTHYFTRKGPRRRKRPQSGVNTQLPACTVCPSVVICTIVLPLSKYSTAQGPLMKPPAHGTPYT